MRSDGRAAPAGPRWPQRGLSGGESLCRERSQGSGWRENMHGSVPVVSRFGGEIIIFMPRI